MMSIHWRLAELWVLKQNRELTEAEVFEMECCLKLNANYALKVAEQYNMSLMASMTNDWSWLHDISANIEKLENIYKDKKPHFFDK